MNLLARVLGRSIREEVTKQFRSLAIETDNEVDDIPGTEVSGTPTVEELRQATLDPTVAGAINLVLLGSLPDIILERTKSNTLAVDVIEHLFDQMPGSPLQHFHIALEEAFVTGRSYNELVKGFVPGGYMGLWDILTAPCENITAEWDDFGSILEVKQMSSTGIENTLALDRLAYYAHRPSPRSPKGRSGIIPGMHAIRRKKKWLRAWGVYLRRRSGFLLASLGDDQWSDKGRAEAKAVLKNIDSNSLAVKHVDHEVQLLESSGTPGLLFQNGIKYQDKQILVSILCQELATTEGLLSGSRAASEEHGDIMWTYLRYLGQLFAEVFIREEVMRKLLVWNGYSALPVPGVSIIRDDMSPKALSEVVTGLVEKQVIPWSVESAYKLMEQMGMGDLIEEDTSISEGEAPSLNEPEEKDDPPPDPTNPDGSKMSKRQQKVCLSKIANRVKIAKRQSKETSKRALQAANAIADTWNRNLPDMHSKIMTEVFKAENIGKDGMLLPERLPAIKNLVYGLASYREAGLKSTFLEYAEQEYKAGQAGMEDLLRTDAAHSVMPKPKMTYRQAIRVLDADIAVRFAEEYAKIGKSIFYSIRSGTMNGFGPREIASSLRQVLEAAAFAQPSRALTITLTELATAHNEARFQTAQSLFDPFGTTPGSIVAMQFVIVDDVDTTDICLERNNQVFRVDDPGLGSNNPPLHFSCRSTYVPIFAGEMGLVVISSTADLKVTPMKDFGRAA